MYLQLKSCHNRRRDGLEALKGFLVFVLEIVSVDIPEEPFNELVLLRLCVLKDGQRDGGGVVLVLRQPDGGDPVSSLLVALRPVEGLQVLQKLRLRAHPSLRPLHTYFVTLEPALTERCNTHIGAIEEELLAAEHPGEGVPVEGD